MLQSGLPEDLEEAIKDLDICTAALHQEFETVELRKGQKARESSSNRIPVNYSQMKLWRL